MRTASTSVRVPVTSNWPSMSTYSDTTGTVRPSLSEKASIHAAGSMVNLSPGAYTVDMRARATASSASPRTMATAGAAMWMPTRQPCACGTTENASSISVVAESSIEKATTSATGRSGGKAGAGRSAAKPVPRGKVVARNCPRCQR